MRLPSREPLDAVLGALDRAGIEGCVGGSALLASLGLVDVVRDWDVTTDAPAHLVVDALRSAGIAFELSPPGGRFGSEAHLVVGDVVDVIVRFTIRRDGEVTELPARVTSVWDGLPMADPDVWALAYELLERTDRAALLRNRPR